MDAYPKAAMKRTRIEVRKPDYTFAARRPRPTLYFFTPFPALR